MKHGKCIFVPQGEYSRMRTTNLNLMMQKGSWVVQQKFSYYLHILKMRSKNKVALAVELSIHAVFDYCIM